MNHNPNVSQLFKVEPIPDEPSSFPAQENTVAIKMMHIALQGLWREAAIAVSNLFSLLTAATVFTLFFVAPADPSVKQLTLLGIYSAFILLANALVIWSRRGK